MNIGEIVQNIATGGAVVLGLIYIIGGLIVNLNLARRGVVAILAKMCIARFNGYRLSTLPLRGVLR